MPELRFVETVAHRIAFLAYEPRRPRGVSIVAGHGYSSSKQNLDPLCSFLASHGFAVYSLDFPGHKLGSSSGTLRGLDDLLDAMFAVMDHARGGPLYALGHSMGAITALLAASADPTVAGVVSIATGIGRIAALEALAARGATDLRSTYVDGVTLPELFAQVEPRLIPALGHLAGRPQLYLAADRDFMVSRSSVEALFERAPEPKTFETISSDHTSAGENARSAVLSWLNALHPRAVAASV
ncbi:MAG: alpha/beta fold hydrolase [Candidatus Eremiobacteraeota bacterium]|nr:alpha/beta fold hydrolase [Candidatus Eremiobacteraeota bacterium]